MQIINMKKIIKCNHKKSFIRNYLKIVDQIISGENVEIVKIIHMIVLIIKLIVEIKLSNLRETES
jgi:hypothetical protein